ncbi:hypothetical protein NL533_31335, partial [Klebsiella pneumoniae]|nr:hypothetical protein [Klebsiella pneumoniae]
CGIEWSLIPFLASFISRRQCSIFEGTNQPSFFFETSCSLRHQLQSSPSDIAAYRSAFVPGACCPALHQN